MNPVAINVEAGKVYWWCSCGLSAAQPFCDGSHKGSEHFPVKYTATHSGELWFCACKRTRSPPLCDGSHASGGAPDPTA
jgi:CDGSH-type Zn-finger protein